MILVTGATGLVGSRLVKELVQRGEKIRILARKSSDRSRIYRVLDRNDGQQRSLIEWVEGDVTDVYAVKDALQGVDRVFHCAGLVNFQPGMAGRLMEVNADGTANVVNMALESGVSHLVHVSSIAALGRNADGEHIDESATWKTSKRNSAYAVSKYSAEREVWRGVAEGLNAAIVNPGVIIGPGNWKTDSSMIYGQVWRGLRFYTRGITGFVDVADVVKAMLLLSEKRISAERYVLVSENKSFREVFDGISDALGKKRPVVYAGTFLTGLAWRAERIKGLLTGRKPVITRETAQSAASQYYYSSNKIRKDFGFEFIPIKTSVEETGKIFVKELRREK
ncbi:MAG TPA: SDR family NAD(P)-dependent oxidoreductase [Bacteroidia bacterium]|nr:SDR family NAD(P)-dependent oxidoreductase [Bacteroidia bacterium]